MRRMVLIVVLLGGSLAGCATPSGSVSSPSSSDSSSSSPDVSTSSPTSTATGQPSGPPPTTIASDQLPSNVVGGTLTVTSSGPCYLVETDDGKLYALIGNGGTVNRGQRVKATIELRATMVDCGSGTPVALVKLETT